MEEREWVGLLCLSSLCLVIACSVALHHRDVGWSAVCEISQSYSHPLFIYLNALCMLAVETGLSKHLMITYAKSW